MYKCFRVSRLPIFARNLICNRKFQAFYRFLKNNEEWIMNISLSSSFRKIMIQHLRSDWSIWVRFHLALRSFLFCEHRHEKTNGFSGNIFSLHSYWWGWIMPKKTRIFNGSPRVSSTYNQYLILIIDERWWYLSEKARSSLAILLLSGSMRNFAWTVHGK